MDRSIAAVVARWNEEPPPPPLSERQRDTIAAAFSDTARTKKRAGA